MRSFLTIVSAIFLSILLPAAAYAGPPPGDVIELSKDHVYSPPPGYAVQEGCNNNGCGLWLVENDRIYDKIAYASKVAWITALAILGLAIVTALLCLIVFIIAASREGIRDMIHERRKARENTAK